MTAGPARTRAGTPGLRGRRTEPAALRRRALRRSSRSLELSPNGPALGRRRGAPRERFLVAAEHEEQQAEPVEPSAHLLVLPSVCALERHAPAFGSTRDGAREVQRS